MEQHNNGWPQQPSQGGNPFYPSSSSPMSSSPSVASYGGRGSVGQPQHEPQPGGRLHRSRSGHHSPSFGRPCKFFQQGTCRFGDDCRFSHETPSYYQPPQQPQYYNPNPYPQQTQSFYPNHHSTHSSHSPRQPLRRSTPSRGRGRGGGGRSHFSPLHEKSTGEDWRIEAGYIKPTAKREVTPTPARVINRVEEDDDAWPETSSSSMPRPEPLYNPPVQSYAGHPVESSTPFATEPTHPHHAQPSRVHPVGVAEFRPTATAHPHQEPQIYAHQPELVHHAAYSGSPHSVEPTQPYYISPEEYAFLVHQQQQQQQQQQMYSQEVLHQPAGPVAHAPTAPPPSMDSILQKNFEDLTPEEVWIFENETNGGGGGGGEQKVPDMYDHELDMEQLMWLEEQLQNLEIQENIRIMAEVKDSIHEEEKLIFQVEESAAIEIQDELSKAGDHVTGIVKNFLGWGDSFEKSYQEQHELDKLADEFLQPHEHMTEDSLIFNVGVHVDDDSDTGVTPEGTTEKTSENVAQ